MPKSWERLSYNDWLSNLLQKSWQLFNLRLEITLQNRY